ncbi:hypothetical protein KC19_10G024100 [Ceratodon purpureus]|uniref:Uncharacterized protein n=1 Tax=Ceratodon purpureus TaxID=3225 RepID=A0A8T0GIL3_CERPU|nr:hypothetical protein KC19_10G024100 [Ceratodon purpureus]
MILASGARGREFDSPNTPSFVSPATTEQSIDVIENTSHSTQIHHSSTVFSHFFLRDETTPSFSTSSNVTQTPRFVSKCNESTKNRTRMVHNISTLSCRRPFSCRDAGVHGRFSESITADGD